MTKEFKQPLTPYEKYARGNQGNQGPAEELKHRLAVENQRNRKQAGEHADYIIAAIKADNVEAFYYAGSCDDFYGAWRLVFRRIARGAIPQISPEIKATFQELWLEHGNWALKIGSPRVLCRALRRLLPEYRGPAVMLYRGGSRHGWRRGLSWTTDVDVARTFAGNHANSDFDSVVVKALVPPEAIICRVAYPPSLTDQERAELPPNCHVPSFDDEQEYLVDSMVVRDFTIERAERGKNGAR